MPLTRIVAVRHGETAWNVQARIQGQLDVALNPRGQQQARRVAAALAQEEIAAIYSSNLLRAWDTALAIADGAGLSVIPEPGLRERSFGDFEGMTFAEVDSQWPEQAARWRKREPHFAPNGGETLHQLRARVMTALDSIAAQHLGQQIVLVTHGGVLDTLYRAATGEDFSTPRRWGIENAAINRLRWQAESFTLEAWGLTDHLKDEHHDRALDESSA